MAHTSALPFMHRNKSFSRLLLGVLLAMLAALTACTTVAPKQTGLTAAQIAVLKAQGFKPTDDGWNLDISAKLLFASDDANLSAESRQRVAKVGQSLLAVGLDRVSVWGFTDSLGNDNHNQALSERRAAAVAGVLIESGMKPENIHQRGYGKNRPIADNRTPEGRAQNRRVAIIVPAQE